MIMTIQGFNSRFRLGVVAWVLLVFLPAYKACAQGTVNFDTCISGQPVNQTIHIWGPSTTDPTLSLVGLGSNDSPSGTTPFGSASGMALIGSNGSGGKYGYTTTCAQLLGAAGLNQPESALVPVGQVTTFRSGSSLGCINGITDILAGSPAIPADAPFASFQVVAWDNSSGSYPTWTQAYWAWLYGRIAAGKSPVFAIENIGGTVNPPPSLNNMQQLSSFNLYYGCDYCALMLRHPESQTVPAGQPVAFTVVACGAATTYGLHYQWHFNGARITGATDSTYILPYAQVSDIGNYSVGVTTTWEMCYPYETLSSNAFLNVSGCPPSLSMEPQSQRTWVGEDVVFTALAIGTWPCSYQWQFDGTNISGATNSSLTLAEVQLLQAGNYAVQVTNLYGLVTSSNAVLTVNPGPPILFTNGLVAYYPFNGNADDASENGMGGVVHGATLTADRFGIPNSAYSFNGTSAYIETINLLPDMQSASASCWINIAAPPTSDRYVFMDGDSSPGSDFYLNYGSDTNVTLMTKDNIFVKAHLLTFTNRWFHVAAVADSNTHLLKMWIDGLLVATSSAPGNINVGYHSQFFIGCRSVYHDYCFSGAIDDVRVYNRALSDSEVQELYQYESASPPGAPLISQQPQSLTLTNGDFASFTVTAIGQLPLTYQWQRDGINLTDSGPIDGSTSNTLSLSTTSLNEAGDYWVIVANAYGSITSSVAVLTLLAPPSITGQPQSQTVHAGSNVVFRVLVSAYPPVSYQWAFNGTNIVGATGASLLLTNAQLNQAGSYSVAATNSMGYVISTSATLTVLAPPKIVSQPRSQIGYWGLSAAFHVGAVGTDPLSYQWYYQDFAIEWGTNATLVLEDLDLDSGGIYWVEVSNSYGTAASQPATLVVNPAAVSPGLYFGLTITGAVGKKFGIQYVTNISATSSWTTITNVTLTQATLLWLDTSVNVSTGDQVRRYYRAVAIP
jgi:hypothetical protein